MDTLASVAILFCAVTVHQQAQQGRLSMQEYVQDMVQSRYPVWLQTVQTGSRA